ncbi:hypothetical protein KY285_030284 [Solanum tuberosum]|nr:hypothetical protein KY285_030284 [Solanum tuberosum]
MEELRQVVFSMNPNSAAGPDGIGDRHSLMLIMDRLGEYESTSGQLINKAKSHFMVPDNTAQDIIHTIKQARVLSFGGRITLIKHALQSIPIHTMAILSPPSTTIKYIETIIADFYWGRNRNKRKYHWASLDTMSLPYTEGGVGIRRLSDICTCLQYKQWWNFRSKVSLWSQFLKDKYCQRAHPVAKKFDRADSLMWKYMMKNKLQVEENIGWKIQSGSCSFWWDDWLGKGALATYNTSISSLNNATITHFLVNGKWNERKLRQQQGWDDVEHIFLQGHFTGHIWKFFAGSMGLQLQQHSLHNQILCWSGVTGKNTTHTMIIHILPIVICWNLWKNRCSAKYGGKTSNIHKEIRVTLVMWKTPPRTRYKLNKDGSALHNPGKIGGNKQPSKGSGCQFWFKLCVHTYREANGTVDLLAKHSHQQDIIQNYYTHHQLPLPVKGSYLLEKLGVQNFKRKKLKRIKQPL